MQHFTTEQLRRARKADLYNFILRNHADAFRREGESLRPKDNRSISIKKGYCGYVDFANGEKGNSIDFLTRHLGYELDQAVFALCGENATYTSPSPIVQPPVKELPVMFPDPATGSYKQLFAFLMRRAIPAETIQYLIDNKLLYQSKEKNNAVFINHERDWAELRGTFTYAEKTFHGIVPNCRRDGFWWFRTSKKAHVAYICESSIDAISLYLLHRQQKTKPDAFYISIGGATKQAAIDRIKQRYHAIIATDNDQAGSFCRQRNAECESIIPIHKDWNDDLQALNNH